MQRSSGEDNAESGVMKGWSHGPWEPGEAAREPPTADPLRDSDKRGWTVLDLLNIGKFTCSTFFFNTYF